MNKEFLQNQSKVFCILPWIHLHTTPSGQALPCCISSQRIKDFGNTNDSSIIEIMNGSHMKQMRMNMITEVENPSCSQCYIFEKQGIRSFRQSANDEFSNFFDETVPYTQEDGAMPEFKMRYFDIRFSNICNFKCRTCGSEYSSQWELEDIKNKVGYAKIIPKNNSSKLVEEILSHIDHIDTAYFAGGEPLITEEHYILLEEMIRRNKTNVKLRYNTNLSNFKFKDKDIVSLWKNFKHKISLSASMDHYGERAEYIRHGTNWSVVEENLKIVNGLDFINTQINTCVSVFNFLTLDKFYLYLIEKGLYKPGSHGNSLYNIQGPLELTSKVLPVELKLLGKNNILELKRLMKSYNFNDSYFSQFDTTINWAESENTWELYRIYFQSEIKRLDSIRGENFINVFPELKTLLE